MSEAFVEATEGEINKKHKRWESFEERDTFNAKSFKLIDLFIFPGIEVIVVFYVVENAITFMHFD